jgi:hypothetical protein
MVLCLGALAAIANPGTQAMPLRVYLAARAETFNVVKWEALHVADQASAITADLVRPPLSDGANLQRIHDYFVAPRGARAEARSEVERAIERELSALISEHGIGQLPLISSPGLLPPVAFEFTPPPSVLVVAPRDRLVVQQSVLLEPGIVESQASEVERRVGDLGVSTLVTPIGGIATYPSMVIESTRAADTLSSVAHEWAHGYLFFRPLGQTYWSSQDGRAINETVAELTGRELGAMLAERANLPVPPGEAPAATDQRFRQEMRSTRLEVERLLSIGAIDEAEQYMERRRVELDGMGYRIRRLNQAYFAFHGSYAESVAADGRVGTLVRRLRDASPNLADFLARVSNVQSVDALRRLVDES